MDIQIFNKIKAAVALHIPKDAIALLYGSQARNDETSESDWDILVILNKSKLQPSDFDNITYPLTKLGWEIDTEINPIMYTKEEWEKSKITPFYQNVQRDAILLNEPK